MVKDLTEGKPDKVLLQFSIPMFVSVIFQQMYSIADSVIAGRFAGSDALAAVGVSYPITMIFMAIAIGSNIGCSVIISQLFGGKKLQQMKTAISTTIITTIILSILLTVFGLAYSNKLMTMINTPAKIYVDGMLYFKIYIAGFIFLFLYNVATGIFNALGDSKVPLYFLIGSSVGNIILDLIFVAIFHMGVAGVAWATFIAQGIACILALITLLSRIHKIDSEKAEKFSYGMLQKISMIAIPSILQQSFVSIGNIFIQKLINGYNNPAVIAGYSAAIKLNTFTITSFTTLGNGLSSFTAQNIGAEKWNRVNKGFRAGAKMAIIVALPFFLVYFFLGEQCMNLFMTESSVDAIATGQEFLRIVSPFYFVICIKLMADGLLRGSSCMKCFMVSTFTDLVLRVVFAYILSGFFDATGIWLSWPVGWTVAMILSYGFYRAGVWRPK